MSTSAVARGSSASIAAAIEDEQPEPKLGLTTTSAPDRFTRERTFSDSPPSATSSWSNSHARAVATVWSSRVAPLYGSSCLGRPSRLEPPAARTSPATNGSLMAMVPLVVRARSGA